MQTTYHISTICRAAAKTKPFSTYADDTLLPFYSPQREFTKFSTEQNCRFVVHITFVRRSAGTFLSTEAKWNLRRTTQTGNTNRYEC